MKKTILLALILLATYALPNLSKAVELTFKFVTTNTISGYDHLSKLVVYSDNVIIAESPQKVQSKSNKVIVNIPAGNHTIKVVLNAFIDGNWEERVKTNDYSLDFVYKKTDNWLVNKTIDLTFDISKEKVIIAETKSNSSEITTKTKSGNYTAALKNLNDFVKTIDNGYYGYLEIVDGYLYDRYKSGKYSKCEIKYLGTAYEEQVGTKVSIPCVDDRECVYSTYTDSYHKSIGFSQTLSFNTSELISLINKVVDIYNGTSNSNYTSSNSNTSNTLTAAEKNATDIRAEIEKKRMQQNTQTNSDESINRAPREIEKTTTKAKYTAVLQKLNDYLQIFNAETYDNVVVKDTKVIFGFKYNGKKYSSSIDIKDLKENTTVIKSNSFGSEEIKIRCKGDNMYFYSTYTNAKADHFRFYSNTVQDLTTINNLLKEFINAL